MSWIGTSPELPSIMLNAHTDVVPVFEEFWTHGPFDATKLENGDIIGRGTQDMKCVAIQYIEAVRNLIAQGVRLARTLHLTFVPDEEIGGHSGMELFVDHERFKALNIGFALDEGLANETDAFTVYYGERAPWWVRVKAVGRPGHGSRFVENTATEKLMRVIEKFLAFRQQQKSLLESGEAKTLGDVTTLNLTMLEGGVQFNIVPAEASAGFDIRIPPTVDLVEFEKQLGVWTSSEEGVTFEFVSKFENNQMTVLDDNNVWWKAFKTACDAQALTLVTEIFPAATDSRYIRQKSIPALGFSPINNTPILLHDHNEFLNEAVFVRGVTVYEHVLKSIGNVPPQ
ncbi:aminoacylase-1A, variant [Capsaspora owczarzaki ATCC 30864]|nr:aminoacylase-1A, variant [Capsaspora owczarzaki ATCC 30864]